jgi:NNP family nitrate/nitrite transporter-like MFS transporter
MGLIGFTVTVFVLGFFMALGKAAVYKHIPVYYPKNVGAVGGLVGMIGGLGGFVLPIAVRRAARPHRPVDELLHAAVRDRVVLADLDALRHPRDGARAAGEKLGELPRTSRNAGRAPPRMAASRPPGARPTGARGQGLLGQKGKRHRARNLWISIPALLLAFAVWMVWSVVVAKLPLRRLQVHHRRAVLARRAAGPVGRDAAHLLLLHGADLRRPAVDDAVDHLVADHPGHRHRLRGAESRHALPDLLLLALLCGFGGGNFASSMSNISFFFPKAEKGNALALNAGLGNLGVSVMQFVVPLVITAGVFGASAASRPWSREAADAPLWLQNAGFIWVPFIIVAAFAAWFGMNDIASAKASFAEQAVIFQRKHNWIMCWLYTGTFGSFIGYSAGFPLLPRRLPGHQRAAIRLPRAAGRRAVALRHRLGGRPLWRRPRHLLGVRADDGGGGWRALLHRHQGPAGRLLGLLRDVHAAVLRHRRRQCLHLPDDPGDHAQGNGPADAAGDAGGPRLQAEKESAAIIGFTSAIAAYGAFFIPQGPTAPRSR